MTKKLLLTTALISALSSGTTAYATDFEVAYNGNNTYTFDGANYASLTLLAQEFKTRVLTGRVNIKNDKIKIKKDTQKTFIVDLISNKNNVRDQFSPLAAAISGNNPAEVSQYLNEFARVISSLPLDQQNELLDTIDLDDIGEFDEEELQDQLVYMEKSVNEKERTKLTQSNFSTIESKLSSENSSIKKLLEERDNLLAAATTLSAEQASRLDSLSKQIGSLKEFVEARNSKETQENLKQRIALIELAVSSNENNALNAKAVADLNQLKKDIDKYLIRDITDTTTLPNVQKSDTAVSEGLMNSLVISRGVVDSRIGGFSAVSAGDLMQAYGVWAQGSMSRGTQKAYGNAPGYKLDQKGITIGADTGDETLLGLAYSFFMNDIKNKANSSNKEDIKSHIVTVYGKFDVTNEMFVSGQAQYGKANIKKKRATGDLANNIASAKTNATSMAAKLEVGYDYEVAPQTYLVPTIGASYANIEIKGYKETGSGLNRSVAKRTTNRTSGLAGITAKYVADMGSMKMIPEIHANVDYAFNTKNSATSVTIINGIDAIAT
ncbi:MAG: autotransporter domain-containing protein, partial [Rickettsiaceae bacterium]|nr:autotransporter domain-containing protein [Rickettsiaceae bacterium]